jgi:hypothetical protein
LDFRKIQEAMNKQPMITALAENAVIWVDLDDASGPARL